IIIRRSPVRIRDAPPRNTSCPDTARFGAVFLIERSRDAHGFLLLACGASVHPVLCHWKTAWPRALAPHHCLLRNARYCVKVPGTCKTFLLQTQLQNPPHKRTAIFETEAV